TCFGSRRSGVQISPPRLRTSAAGAAPAGAPHTSTGVSCVARPGRHGMRAEPGDQMRTEEAIPRTAPDLSDLARLVQRPGPFLTVYLGTDPAVENAGPRSEQRWRTCRQDLEEQGAPEDVLATVDPLVAEAHL